MGNNQDKDEERNAWLEDLWIHQTNFLHCSRVSTNLGQCQKQGGEWWIWVASSPLRPLGSEKSYCKDHTVETRKHNSQSITLQSVQKLHVTFVSHYCWSIKCFDPCDLELQTVFWHHPRQRIELLGSFVKSSFNLDLNVFASSSSSGRRAFWSVCKSCSFWAANLLCYEEQEWFWRPQGKCVPVNL